CRPELVLENEARKTRRQRAHPSREILRGKVGGPRAWSLASMRSHNDGKPPNPGMDFRPAVLATALVPQASGRRTLSIAFVRPAGRAPTRSIAFARARLTAQTLSIAFAGPGRAEPRYR